MLFMLIFDHHRFIKSPLAPLLPGPDCLIELQVTSQDQNIQRENASEDHLKKPMVKYEEEVRV